jgi:hypothetical protein
VNSWQEAFPASTPNHQIAPPPHITTYLLKLLHRHKIESYFSCILAHPSTRQIMQNKSTNTRGFPENEAQSNELSRRQWENQSLEGQMTCNIFCQTCSCGCKFNCPCPKQIIDKQGRENCCYYQQNINYSMSQTPLTPYYYHAYNTNPITSAYQQQIYSRTPQVTQPITQTA